VVLVAFNFTPIIRYDYYIGVPRGGFWTELLCSDAPTYGGSGVGNQGGVIADDVVWHGRPAKLRVTLPPLAAVIFVHRGTKAVSTPDP
jgi:1,4-alpha-glucan branching enzyme